MEHAATIQTNNYSKKNIKNILKIYKKGVKINDDKNDFITIRRRRLQKAFQ